MVHRGDLFHPKRNILKLFCFYEFPQMFYVVLCRRFPMGPVEIPYKFYFFSHKSYSIKMKVSLSIQMQSSVFISYLKNIPHLKHRSEEHTSELQSRPHL